MPKLTDQLRAKAQAWLATGLTGGGSTKLDGIATVSETAGVVIEVLVSGVYHVYRLKSGTEAESSPAYVRPDDYAATTNEKVWEMLFICSATYFSVVKNFGMGTAIFGTNADRVIGFFNGTAPTTSPTDTVQIWAADRGAAAGKSSLHGRAEDGTQWVMGDLFGFGRVDPSFAFDFLQPAGLSSLAARLVTQSTNSGWRIDTLSGTSTARNYFIGSNVAVYGDFGLIQSAALGGDPLSGGTCRMYFDKDGNLALGGGTSPQAVLHNGGSTRLDGTLALNPSTLQTLAAGAAILANAGKVRVAGSGGAVTLTSAPTIADGVDGQLLYIVGTHDTNTLTVQDRGTLASSNLALQATTRVLGKGDILALMFDTTDSLWYEVSFANNL